MNCNRCGKEITEGALHLVTSRSLAEMEALSQHFNMEVSYCLKPVRLLTEPYLCRCKLYLVESEEYPCPICGMEFEKGFS